MYMLQKQETFPIQSISFLDKDYPQEFREIGEDKPSCIYLLGNQQLLYAEKKVAIIGMRKCDQPGKEIAYKLGMEYAQKGYVVISGLALGCDTAAHLGCLDAEGHTIAIVASGLDRTHPKENKWLQDRISQNNGLLLSEQPVGVKANPTRLIARNRFQAALADFVIVVQSPLESGTMHTVRFAQKYGKAIYAVRYEEWNERNEGNKYLLEQEHARPIIL